MSDEGADESGESEGKSLVERAVSGLVNFDWLHIPGATRAIARLVGSVAEAGSATVGIATAKAKQASQGIDNDTAAQKVLAQALAKAAAKQGVSSPEMVQRHLDIWASGQVRKQQNKEGVAEKTIRNLQDDPPTQDTEGPDDDWINVFEAYAEKASSDRLRETWARVLAGEIRKPGSVSLLTLQFLSVLDQETAHITEELLSRTSGGKMLFTIPAFNTGEDIVKRANLAALGVLTDDKTWNGKIEENGEMNIVFMSHVIHIRGVPGGTLPLPVTILTRLGGQLLNITSLKSKYADVDSVAEYIRHQHREIVQAVHVCDIVSRIDGQVFFNRPS